MQEPRNNQLTLKVLLPLFLSGLVIIAIIVSMIFFIKNKNLQLAGLNTAEAIANQVVVLRDFYTENIVVSTEKPLPLPDIFVREISAQISQTYPSMFIRFFSSPPFSAEIETPDQFELDAQAALKKDPEMKYYTIEPVQGHLSMRFAIADVMCSGCADFYNAHSASPKSDWKAGEVRGVLEVIIPLDTIENKLNEDAMTFSLLVVGLLVIIIAALFIVFKGTIIEPTHRIVKMMMAISEGDLNHRLNPKSNDEFGQISRVLDNFADNLKLEVIEAFQKLSKGDFTFEAEGVIKDPLQQANDSLNNTIVQVQTTSEIINSGASKLVDSSQTLSEGTTSQAAALEEFAHSMETLASRTQQSTENAMNANKLSETSREHAENGNQQMDQMQRAMEEINLSSENISKIIRVIDEIAFQTNLLALNAAVEASRAGRYGKGFAVVAEEVRSLAQRSAEAAKETTEMIEDAIRKVKAGTQIADETASVLEKIVSSVTEATAIIDQISIASNEQSTKINEINTGLSHVNTVIQHNSQVASENASISEKLFAQSQALKEMVAHFKLQVQSKEQTQPPSPTSYKSLEPSTDPGSADISMPLLEDDPNASKEDPIFLTDEKFRKV